MFDMYLRKEKRDGRDVVAYYGDSDATKLKCVNPWPSRPTKRNKYIMFNCARYSAKWLPDTAGK